MLEINMATQTSELTTENRQISKLAILGGNPIVAPSTFTSVRWPRVETEDIEAIVRVLRGGLLTEISARDLVHNFETEVGMWLGTRYALTTNNGTPALNG